MRHPAKSDTCFMAEIVEAIVSNQSGLTDPLEASLVQNREYERRGRGICKMDGFFRTQ